MDSRASNDLITNVVQRYPFSMLFSLFSSCAWTGVSLYARSPEASIPALQAALLLCGFVMEFKRLIPHPVKIKHHFDDKRFDYQGQLAAILQIENNSTPSLEVYSSSSGMLGLARAKLQGQDFLELRRKYAPFLFLNAQLRKGPIFQDAIKTINQRTCERGIDIKYRLHEFHQFLLEANKLVIQNNLSSSAVLQDAPITIDELRAWNHFPDDFKGNLACSVYLPGSGKSHDFDMVRNFDWPSAGELFTRFSRVIYRTKYNDLNNPQFVISWTLPTNPGFTATNGHIVLAMNEVETYETMRRNPEGGLGQFDLFYRILENCCTLEEIENFIHDHPPASPWILLAATRSGRGVFEMLPTNNKSLYRFIPAGEACVATNHFQDMPETSTISCSVTRQEKMKKILQDHPHEPWKIAAASSTNDTGHTLVAKFREDGCLIIQSNIANYNSAIAKDANDNQFHYDELNVTEYGKEFLERCEKKHTELLYSSADEQLLILCQAAYKIKDEKISQCMRDIYSQLMFEKSKIALNHPEMQSTLTLKKIENIARYSSVIINAVDEDKNDKDKLLVLQQYEKNITAILPDELNRSVNYMYVMLGFAFFAGVIAKIYEGPSPLALMQTGWSWLTNNLSAACAISSASVPLISSFRTSPNIAFFTQRLTEALKEKVNDENRQVRQLAK